MKGLLDIQKEVKEVEATIQGAVNSLDCISREIQEIRTSNDNMEVDYDMIRMLAKNVPFANHPIAKLEDEYACKLYIELLLSVMHMDTNGIIEKMVFIQWILKEARLDIVLEDAYAESLELEKDTYFEIGELLNIKYRMFFIVDALIVANFAGKANEDTTEYIGKLCTLMRTNTSYIENCIVLAKIALEQSAENLKNSDIERVMPFIHKYKYCITKDTIKKVKLKCREVCVDSIDYLTWLVKQRSLVNKGDLIARYGFLGFTQKKVYASKDGKLFQFHAENYMRRIGVISHPSDTDKEIKQWLQEKYGMDVTIESV
ncbi:MAG: hypothetical protein K2N73_11665 [Lachnospiraceae bacterium]|nr:hypothetical protein [Lachnospiraceae bacterium]